MRARVSTFIYTYLPVYHSYAIGMGYLEVLSLPLTLDDTTKSLRRKAPHREMLLLLDGGRHPKNLQPYLEPVVEMMVRMELEGLDVDENMKCTGSSGNA